MGLGVHSGSECYSEVNLSEPKIDFPKEESWIKDTVPDLDLQEHKVNFLKMKLFSFLQILF